MEMIELEREGERIETEIMSHKHSTRSNMAPEKGESERKGVTWN